MSIFLVRDFDDPRGYRELDAPDDQLPRRSKGYVSIGTYSSGVSYVPWALTGDGRVVYAKTGEHAGWRGGSGPHRLRQYDTAVSQERRAKCQSVFGMLALDQPRFTQSAVSQVSEGIIKYLKAKFWTDPDGIAKLAHKEIGHYFFTGGRTGFGRISEKAKSSTSPQQFWSTLLDTLGGGRLDQVMSLHDAVGRKLLNHLGGPQLDVYRRWGPILRQDWFDDEDKRGRAKVPGRVAATRTGGIVKGGADGVGTTRQSRSRGVDMFARDTARMRDEDGDAYYDDVDARNLLFGAGISGTTGSLLQAGFAFGGLASGELVKQYVMAIIGYLVGGGMHSYHETMAVAQKAGVEYDAGGYLRSLPRSFRDSAEFRRWHADYYDIVTLGPIHWRYNATCLPSHLNGQLRT